MTGLSDTGFSLLLRHYRRGAPHRFKVDQTGLGRLKAGKYGMAFLGLPIHRSITGDKKTRNGEPVRVMQFLRVDRAALYLL
jgi:hypothetical protein